MHRSAAPQASSRCGGSYGGRMVTRRHKSETTARVARREVAGEQEIARVVPACWLRNSRRSSADLSTRRQQRYPKQCSVMLRVETVPCAVAVATRRDGSGTGASRSVAGP